MMPAVIINWLNAPKNPASLTGTISLTNTLHTHEKDPTEMPYMNLEITKL